MHISTVTLSGFQCFGPEPTQISLEDEVTALIGANSSGKTALLEALLRLFGASQSQRRVHRGDFYMAPGESLDDEDVTERSLWIEARIEIPELLEGANSAVAPFFQKTHITGEGPPYIRARLEATWREDVTPEGSIQENAFWVSAEGEPTDDIPDADKEPMRTYDRGKILVEYIPAQRDAVEEVRRKTGSVVSRLLDAVNWSDDVKNDIEEAAKTIREAASGEEALQIINENLGDQWGQLHRGPYDANPTLHVVKQQFRELIQSVDVSFQPTEVGDEHNVDDLSDGLQSLFHLSLLLSYYRILIALASEDSTPEDVNSNDTTDSTGGGAVPVSVVEEAGETHEADIIPGTEGESHDEGKSDGAEREEAFLRNKIDPPSLVVLALEEPENHLSPYYLSRIIAQIRDLVDSVRVQSLLTSHSASTLTRIKPEEIRHLRLRRENRTSHVVPIQLPSEPDELHKYVRQAVRAFPELYFAKFVVFGEGDSEEIVLPRLAEAIGMQFDPSFVAMVPLGGRHVNHFWRLVTNLGISHATLLDLDVGRNGGGWGRIQYALKQLLEVGHDPANVLNVNDGPTLSEEDLESLSENRDLADREEIDVWIEHLESFGVFFSQPLDLDWSMLTSFEDAYQETALDGPQGGVENAIEAVLKGENVYEEANEAGFYGDEDEDRFRWYRYLFSSRSKPQSHLGALSSIPASDDGAANQIPDELKKLLNYAEDRVQEV
jgi:putative ATP-dependent endonuclease of OLD family